MRGLNLPAGPPPALKDIRPYNPSRSSFPKRASVVSSELLVPALGFSSDLTDSSKTRDGCLRGEELVSITVGLINQ